MDKILKQKVVEKLIGDRGVIQYNPFSGNIAGEMLKKISIKKPLVKLEDNLKAREWAISGNDIERVGEIEKRLSGLNMSVIIEYFALSMCYGYGIFEKVYNEKFEIEGLIPIPHRFLEYDVSKKVYKVNQGSNIYLDDPNKFLEIKYKGDLANRGESILEVLYESYMDIKTIKQKLRRIIDKYGDTLVIFGYSEGETDKEIKAKGKRVKEMTAEQNVLAVEVKEGEKVGDWHQLVNLNDLKTDIHQTLEDRYKKEIDSFILGADFTNSQNATGSQARDNVQENELEKKENSIFKWIRDSLQDLIKMDGYFFGYDSREFYFSFEKEKDEEKEADIEKKRSDSLKVKTEAVTQLLTAGVDIDLTYVEETLGIPLLSKTLKKKDNIVEFADDVISKKKKLDIKLEEDFFNKREEAMSKYTDDYSKEIKNHLELSQTKLDLAGFVSTSNILEDHFIISAKTGIADEDDIANIISSFNPAKAPNPYNMNFENTFSFFSERKPALIDEFEEITNDIRANFSWIKKSNDKRVTEKLFKNLLTSEKNGESFESWKSRSAEVLEECGFGKDAWYLKNIYRTNNATAYNLGRYKQQVNTQKLFPYLMYAAVKDKRTTKLCMELDGAIYLATSSIWLRIYPPNHFQCRSRVISFSKEELLSSGYKISEKPKEAILGQLKTFDGNVGDYWKWSEKNYKKAEKASNKAYEQLKLA